MKNFVVICGLDEYKFHQCFYWWTLEVVQDYILSISKNENDEIVLIIGDEIAADIPFLRERCGYGMYR